ncbi:hypothetical protein LILAB_09655 [Corallococcus macrosporus]|uniref:Uncharacterized protein n=1 Tax=Myxococcus fulvus (strain ATCC BAA-855 / HW-1) TaxID=483219 RepID=F8CJM7_MYXFH|nr:hypothetical protein LILAB_09655 [Corallococcus macrosporus]
MALTLRPPLAGAFFAAAPFLAPEAFFAAGAFFAAEVFFAAGAFFAAEVFFTAAPFLAPAAFFAAAPFLAPEAFFAAGAFFAAEVFFAAGAFFAAEVFFAAAPLLAPAAFFAARAFFPVAEVCSAASVESCFAAGAGAGVCSLTPPSRSALLAARPRGSVTSSTDCGGASSVHAAGRRLVRISSRSFW